MRKSLLAGVCAIALLAAACSSANTATTEDTLTPTTTSSAGVASAPSTAGTSSALASAGQSPTSSASGTVTITDLLGRKVTIPKNVKRILALHPIPTDLLAIMAPDRQVSIDMVFQSRLKTAQPEYTPEEFKRLSSLPVTGVFFKGLNTEQLVELKPDVVITLVTDPNLDKLSQQLNIPFVAVSKAPTSAYEQTIRLLGQIVGEPARADAMADFWAATMKQVQDRTATVPEADRKRVMYTGQNGNILSTPGKNTVFGSSIDAAGGVNVGDELTGAAATTEGNSVSMEQILRWDPDVIITGGEAAKNKILKDPQRQTLKAVKAGKVYSPGAFTGMDGLQALLGLVWLQGVLLDGDSAAAQQHDTDVAQQYYRLFYGHELTTEQLAMKAK